MSPGVECVNHRAVFAASFAYREGLWPLPFDRVKYFFLLSCWVHGGGEGILLPAHPSLTAIVDLGGEARGRGDVGAAIEFHKRFSVDKAFDVDIGEGDEVGFVVMGGKGEEGMADLFDVDGTAEGGFLAIVPFELFVEKSGQLAYGRVGNRGQARTLMPFLAFWIQ